MKAPQLCTPQLKKGTDAAIAKLLHDVLHNAAMRTPKESRKNRKQIAGELTAILGTEVRVYMLNEFAAPTKAARHLPAAWVPAISKITGDDRLQRLLLGEPLCSLLQLGESALKAIENSRAASTAETTVRAKTR